jgi:hypothetical protein
VDREMRASVRSTGKRPREAFGEAMESLTKRFKSAEEYDEVVKVFPSYNDVRRQLSRHRLFRCRNPVPDVPVPEDPVPDVPVPEDLVVTPDRHRGPGNATFSRSHPSVTAFLDWLQQCQDEVSRRSLQFAADRPLEQRLAACVRVAERIQKKKVQFAVNFGRAFADCFPCPSSTVLVQEVIEKYVDDMASLVSGGGSAAECENTVDTTEG